MCEPWGSFLVDRMGQVYAKDGVLSHTKLMEEFFPRKIRPGIIDVIDGVPAFPGVRPDQLFQPEFNWLKRTLDDFNRHDLEEVPGSRTCRAVDDYVNEQFGTSDRFFHWLERGNWLESYKQDYSALFRTGVLTKKEAWIETKSPCLHDGRDWRMKRYPDLSKLREVLSLVCEKCVTEVRYLLEYRIVGLLEIKEAEVYARVFERLKEELKTRPQVVEHPEEKELVGFSQFADLWREPQNRVEVWSN